MEVMQEHKLMAKHESYLGVEVWMDTFVLPEFWCLLDLGIKCSVNLLMRRNGAYLFCFVLLRLVKSPSSLHVELASWPVQL